MVADPRFGFGQRPLLSATEAGADGSPASRQDDAPPEPDGTSHMANGASPARSTDSIVRVLANTPDDLERLVDGKSTETLMQPAQDGGWGIVELVPLARDWEQIHAERVDRILREEQPRIEEQDDSLWAIERNYREQDTHAALREFRHLREALVSRLDKLDEDEWARTAVHPRLGVISLHALMDRVCDHDARHVQQVKDVLG